MKSNPGQVPRIPKLVFLWVDVFLLLVAALIPLVADPGQPVIFSLIVGCIALAALVALVPFLLDYAAASAESAQLLEARAGAQIARLEAASEALARAAAQVQSVEAAVHKAAKDAETLPYRMQEKLAEFNQALAEKEDEQRSALEQELTELRAAQADQLKAAANRIKETIGELTALEKNARAQLAASEAAAAKLAGAGHDAAARIESALDAALARLDSKLAEFAAATEKPARRSRSTGSETAPPSVPAPEPVAEVTVTESTIPAESPVPSAAESPMPATLTADPLGGAPVAEAEAAEPARPRKPRPARKPRSDEGVAAISTDAPVSVVPAPTPEPATNDLSAEAAPKAETSSSADGATRLLATAYIGIGNKLFIRGDGPGLSWDSGVPMQFVSIGKWGWSTHEATGPVTIRLYKNDETPALSGDIVLEPGRHTEVTALF